MTALAVEVPSAVGSGGNDDLYALYVDWIAHERRRIAAESPRNGATQFVLSTYRPIHRELFEARTSEMTYVEQERLRAQLQDFQPLR